MFYVLKNLARDFRRNESGQFAVITAMIGLPLIMISGFSLDFNQANQARTEIKAALDAAALAAVIPANMEQAERKAYAQTMFDQNYFGDLGVSLNANANRERVELVATAKSNTLFGGIAGFEGFDLKAEATAELTRADVVCILALDPIGENAIEFLDFAQFSAPACSVQTNSTHSQALYSTSSKSPIAKSFCSAGESKGNFAPIVKHACSPIEDPYKDLTAPADSPCVDVKKLSNGWQTAVDPFTGDDIIGDGVILLPGHYCKGLDIKGINVQMKSGNYIISGGQFKVSKVRKLSATALALA